MCSIIFCLSFLKNRIQKVKIGKLMTIGEPQGSEHGVLFFLIYINDFPGAMDSYTNVSNALTSAATIQELLLMILKKLVFLCL